MGDKKLGVQRSLICVHEDGEELIKRSYSEPTGLRMTEYKSFASESDFSNGNWKRESPDNGRTWGDWTDVYGEVFQYVDGTDADEILWCNRNPDLYDPKSGRFVTCGMQRYFIGGHVEAYRKEWSEGGDDARDHCYLISQKPGEEAEYQLLRFEECDEYDPENPRNRDYLYKSNAYFGDIRFASNGDLLIPLGASIGACCRILGIDINEVFPSCPQIMCGMILVRAHWNGSAYELSYSKPVILNDLQSSRGVCEPCVAELTSGRIIVAIRGSNVQSPAWKTRIDPCAPGFKWYCCSDDGGRTFSPIMPWVFDTREVVYSSATLSTFFRSTKNGRLYWIGNVTDPQKTYGNYPRYPLHICEVDEKYGCLVKDTLTEIDTRREGDSELVQLSNFSLLENRETLKLEIRLARIGMHSIPGEGHDLYSETWLYEIDFPV